MSPLLRLIEWDKKVFLSLNSMYTPWLDWVMLTVSSLGAWLAILALVIIYMTYKGGEWRKAGLIFLLLALGTNVLLNTLVKELVARPRPIHIEAWSGIIHAIEKYEASYSFFSAHSSNSFCLAVFSLLFFKNKYYTALVLGWAVFVSYSRIYLAKHYPLDVLCGILFGTMMGILGYKIFEYYKTKRNASHW